MITEELLKYIENERKSGKDDARIREVLKSEGWSEEDIKQALNFKENNSLVKRDNITLFLLLSFFFLLLVIGLLFFLAEQDIASFILSTIIIVPLIVIFVILFIVIIIRLLFYKK